MFMNPMPMDGFGDYSNAYNIQPSSAVKGNQLASAVKTHNKKDHRRNTAHDIGHQLFSLNDLNYKPKVSQMKYSYAPDASPRHPE